MPARTIPSGAPPAAALREHFLLDPAVTFLNHGSFGACPRSVLAVQSGWRDRMEREPVRFFVHDLPALVDEARSAAASFVGADPEGFAFVRNVTAGVNAVLRSVSLEPGDELLTTDHAYGACQKALAYVADRSGARVVRASVPFAPQEPDEIIEAIAAAVSPRTKLALVDHVTSATGIVFPIAEIVRMLEKRGVDTLVDGAHAPGMLELDVTRVGAAYYTANFHKWVCAPKGSGFLFVRPDRRAELHPALISHGHGMTIAGRSPYWLEFDWTGTDDPTPWLAVPEAIRFVASLVPGGWPAVRQRNRQTVLAGRGVVASALARLGFDEARSLVSEPMVGSLASIPLPDGRDTPPTSPLYSDPLHEALFDRHGVEVPVAPWPAPPARLVRISAHVYNGPADYQALARALTEELTLQRSRA
jgi:isopenicillin-N epimerase